MRARSGWLKGLNPTVAITSKALVLALVLFGVLATGVASSAFVTVRDAITASLGWWYLWLVLGALVFVIGLAASPAGRIRLGRDDERPSYSWPTWFAMLFASGMGIGLVYWGVAEPVMHYVNGAPITPGDPSHAQSSRSALAVAFFHAGLHPWSVYALSGAALAYFSYRQGLPLTVRSALHPLIGARIYGPIGHAADILAVLATTLGVATSLGFGVQQINAGLDSLIGWRISVSHQIILIGLITTAAVISVASGLDRGIRFLSQINILLAAALLAFVAAVGPTAQIIETAAQGVLGYARNFIAMSLPQTSPAGAEWQASWTTFFWAWWVSWAPFVGLFIARISRGRTLREFILGAVLAPTLASIVWIGVVGGAAMVEMGAGDAAGINAAIANDPAMSFYALLGSLTAGWVSVFISAAATLLVVVFFVTSSDSGTFITNTILSVGAQNPPLGHRIVWGVSEGAVAAVLLAAGGLGALQAAAISAALPYSFIMAAMALGLTLALIKELRGAAPRDVDASATEPASKTEAS